VFILAYNLARDSISKDSIVNILIIANVLSVLYCLIQLAVGPGETVQFFGSKEFAFNENRGEGDARLVGPFGTPGLTAAYFMSMTLILIYRVSQSVGWGRNLVAGLAVANVAMIMATANRGSFLVLIAGILGFLYIFRTELGVSKIVQIVVASSVVLFGTATVIAAYTDFGQMFDRLAKTTETEEGLPETRAALWPEAWENIKEKPLIGHGPRVVMQKELRYRNIPDEQLVAPFAHNLYLHLLVTVGVLGTACMLYFFFSVIWRVYKAVRDGKFETPRDRGYVFVGVIVLIAFLIDELKIEFLRFSTVDYAHFVFALFGLFLGWADQAMSERRAERNADYSASFTRTNRKSMSGAYEARTPAEDLY
jgi:O-antigen ligase